MSSDTTTTRPTTRGPLNQGSIKTDSGTLHWDFSEHTPITLHGYLPFFAQFMQAGNLFSDWVEDCPLAYSSNNAPMVKDVLGTIVLSVLSGHSRYCHSSALYGDEVASSLLGLSKIVSHDSLSRGLKKMDADKAEEWLHTHLLRKTEPLLQHAYVLDIDATVKTVYGSQEGVEEALPHYDWSILVTSLDYDLRAISQLYRDRGDCENVFDELKNQWGWGGFTTQSLKPTRIMAGIIQRVEYFLPPCRSLRTQRGDHLASPAPKRHFLD